MGPGSGQSGRQTILLGLLLGIRPRHRLERAAAPGQARIFRLRTVPPTPPARAGCQQAHPKGAPAVFGVLRGFLNCIGTAKARP